MRRLILIGCLMTASLAEPALAHQEKLAGGDWVLAGASGQHVPFLRFDGGRVAGSGGCNRFGGKYELAGAKLSFSPFAATRMACPPEIMKTEQGFFTMLGQVRGMKLEGETLELLDGGGEMIGHFTRRMAD